MAFKKKYLPYNPEGVTIVLDGVHKVEDWNSVSFDQVAELATIEESIDGYASINESASNTYVGTLEVKATSSTNAYLQALLESRGRFDLYAVDNSSGGDRFSGQQCVVGKRATWAKSGERGMNTWIIKVVYGEQQQYGAGLEAL